MMPEVRLVAATPERGTNQKKSLGSLPGTGNVLSDGAGQAAEIRLFYEQPPCYIVMIGHISVCILHFSQSLHKKENKNQTEQKTFECITDSKITAS